MARGKRVAAAGQIYKADARIDGATVLRFPGGEVQVGLFERAVQQALFRRVPSDSAYHRKEFSEQKITEAQHETQDRPDKVNDAAQNADRREYHHPHSPPPENVEVSQAPSVADLL
jgi:hypothetical protein